MTFAFGQVPVLNIQSKVEVHMVRFLSIAIDALSTALILLPVMFVVLHILKGHTIGKKIKIIIFAIYVSAVFSVTGIPAINSLMVDLNFNWIPLIDIVNSPAAYIKNTMLNIALFIPLGFLCPTIWKEYNSLKKVVIMGFGLSAGIEVLQIFTFRLTDVDDLITNTIGTVLGYYLARYFQKLQIQSESHTDKEYINRKYEPFFILTVTFLIMFLTKPLISQAIWESILSSSWWETIR